MTSFSKGKNPTIFIPPYVKNSVGAENHQLGSPCADGKIKRTDPDR